MLLRVSKKQIEDKSRNAFIHHIHNVENENNFFLTKYKEIN